MTLVQGEIAIDGLFSGWIVVGIDVVELEWSLAVDLNDGLAAGHGEVMHFGIEEGEAAGGEGFGLVGIKLIAHANPEGAGDYRDVFAKRMPVRRDAIAVGHFQANRIVAA